MRAGGVEPSRMGKKKRSPKRRHERSSATPPSSQHSQNKQPNDKISATMTTTATPNTAAAATSLQTAASTISTTVTGTVVPMGAVSVAAAGTEAPVVLTASAVGAASNEAEESSENKERPMSSGGEPSESALLSTDVSCETMAEEIIATTPAALPQEKTVIDINNSFQVTHSIYIYIFVFCLVMNKYNVCV